MRKSQRITTLAILTALGMIAFMIESLFPPLFIPGAKMGISNIFSLLTLIILGPFDAIVVVIVRTLLGSFFAGNVSTIIYSMSAGLVSIMVSILLMELAHPHISIMSISIVSAIIHNLTQNLVFCLVSNTPQMVVYMPYLGLIGILAGAIVGTAVILTIKTIPLKVFQSLK